MGPRRALLRLLLPPPYSNTLGTPPPSLFKHVRYPRPPYSNFLRSPHFPGQPCADMAPAEWLKDFHSDAPPWC